MAIFVDSAKIIQLGNLWMLQTSDGQSRQFKDYMLLEPNMPLKVGMDVLLTLDNGLITAIWCPPNERNDDKRQGDVSESSEKTENSKSVNAWQVALNVAKKMFMVTDQKSQKELLGEFTDLWGKVVLELTGSWNEQEEANMAEAINRAYRAGKISEQDKDTLHKIRKLRNAIQHPQNEIEHERAKRKVDEKIINSLRNILERIKAN